MPFYRALSPTSTSPYPFEAPIDPAERARVADGLLRLRSQFRGDRVPERSLNGTLLLATWNLREFGGSKYEERRPESLYYIAEVISHFDIVAVQEIRPNLKPLQQVMAILGPWWKYIMTDVTLGTSGNQERMAFVYDSRKVDFAGLAGEVVLPPEMTKKKDSPQLARTPFLCGFKAHWVRLNLCTVHIYYGEGKPDDKRRVKEVRDLTSLLVKRIAPTPQQAGSAAQPHNEENLVLLGDFNIFTEEDEEFAALKEAGLMVPPELMKRKGSNLDQSKLYDQIAFKPVSRRFETTGKAGVFNYYQSVYRAEDEETYAGLMSDDCRRAYKDKPAGKRSAYYSQWKTFQMSDHLPLWIELRIDFGESYLREAAGHDPHADHGGERQLRRAALRSQNTSVKRTKAPSAKRGRRGTAAKRRRK